MDRFVVSYSVPVVGRLLGPNYGCYDAKSRSRMLSMPYIICPGTEFYLQILEATKASLVKISHTRKFTARPICHAEANCAFYVFLR